MAQKNLPRCNSTTDFQVDLDSKNYLQNFAFYSKSWFEYYCNTRMCRFFIGTLLATYEIRDKEFPIKAGRLLENLAWVRSHSIFFRCLCVDLLLVQNT